jgi:hypothetical protein
VNGHNPSNFIGFQHSAEQISYRNEQIRKTYETNPNLSDKIAASVVQAFKDPTKKKNLHDGQVRGWKDPVRRRKLSERNIAMLEAGIIGPQAPFKTQWILNPFTGKQEYMHSSWETAFLQQCAQKQLPVSKVHSIRIPYTDNKGKEHIYIPDFVTMSKDSKNFLFEIKGRETDIDKIKYTAATNWCNVNGYEFIVVYAVTASTTLST